MSIEINMGPSLIFDKSALQMLNADESLWLDSYFISNITPIFFAESLADLEKEIRKGRSAEDIVGDLAYKTPEMGCVNTFHENLVFGELTGQAKVEMQGRPVLSGGTAKILGGQTGVIYEEPPEVEAFKRWKKREFLDIERTIAKKWRSSISEWSSGGQELFKNFFIFHGVPKNLSELKSMVDYFLSMPDRMHLLTFSTALLGVSEEYQGIILKRWRDSGSPDLKDFAPYFLHVFSLDLFFYLGMSANLFNSFPHAQTHKIDLTYLYYLPFCNIFTSNDKFHQELAPFFMRDDQTFIKGSDLKDDLKRIDQYYSAFPEDVKNRGTMTFAISPPDNTEYWITRMWDKYMSSSWRDMHTKKFDGTDVVDEEKEKELRDKMNKFFNEGEPVDMSSLKSLDQAHSLGIKRMVSARKGKWVKFPPEVLKSKPILKSDK